MADLPDTQLSLILRLPTSARGQVDQDAWAEFTRAYEPFLYRFACRRGLQDCDARELIQRVLLSVAQSIGRWQPCLQEVSSDGGSSENSRPRFRNWLFTIARNQTINLLKAKRADVGVGGTTQLTRLCSSIDPSSNSPCLEDDYRYEMFLWAVAKVKQSVADDTWQAFWKTAVQQEACANVAADLGLSLGSVYAARSRVLAKLKAQIQIMGTSDLPSERPVQPKEQLSPGAAWAQGGTSWQ